MKAYYTGYSAAVFAGFVLYAVTHLPEDSSPLLFLLLFLTIWPLITIMVGYEPIIHLEFAHEKKTGSKPPKRWNGDVRDGAITGSIFAVILLVCMSQAERSWWFWGVPVVAAFVSPVIGAQFSLRRFTKNREQDGAEQAPTAPESK